MLRSKSGRGLRMAIYRFLQNLPFGPEEVAVLVRAYERALKEIGLVDRNDPITEMVAKKIIEVAQRGVREPIAMSQLAVKELGAGWIRVA